MRRAPWTRAATLAIGASFVLSTPAIAAPGEKEPKPSPGVTRQDIQQARETERYWTPERIREAVPADSAPEQAAPGARRKRSLQEPTRPAGDGIATVGVFLFRNDDGTATSHQFCSASSVTSPTKSLVITAAHCLKGDKPLRDVAFVPGYRAGATKAGEAGETPYGIFPLKPGKVWIDGRYLQRTPNDDVDFAFLRVGPNSQGQLLEDATGRGNELTAVRSADLSREDVTIVGYPGGQKTPLRCTNTTTAFQGRFMEIKCDGFRSGVSGGPFLENFDGARGNLVGVIGGYKTGGLYDHTSYTSQFDEDVFRLYDQAVNDKAPDAGNPLGDATMWQHTKQLAAGRFHSSSVRNGTSDLIVRWSDGEVSLYPGNGTYGLGKDIQLVAGNDTWKHAQAVTAGNFAGEDTDDLLVRWSDGELTLYKDVNEQNKLRNEIQLKAPNALWKHAVGMTAGRFDGGTRSDDLVVRWSDGEVTLYTDIDAKGLHTEKQLTAANRTWPYARDIVAGDFSATSSSQDLIVRWNDGEVSAYEDLAANGLKAEHQLRAPGSPWRTAAMTAAGAFGGGARSNDLVVRWSDGKLALNADTTTRSLGQEHTLVPHPNG